MKECPYCRKANPDKAKTCFYCKAELPEEKKENKSDNKGAKE